MRVKKDSQQKFNYYQEKQKFYLETYWKNNDEGNLYRPNGFENLPENIYQAFCEQIDKNGKILDLGCGNGLMLRYLMEATGYKLIPYGIDFIKPPIKQAKEVLHPQYAAHFVVGNVIDYSFKSGPFDFIFATIHHIHPADRGKYLQKIKKHCKKEGKIIFYEYSDVLKQNQYNWVGEFPELKDWRLVRKDFPGVSIAVWKKT